MKEKIKKIFRIITTIIALIWLVSEIGFPGYFESPSLTVVIGILIMWGIATYSLKENKSK
mgnify:CR=1 FL=1